MSAILFIAYCLAVWRLSFMLVKDDGPFDCFASFRELVGVSYDEYSNVVYTNTLSKALTCVGCVSVWVSMFLFVICAINIMLFSAIVYPLAASAIATMINQRL